MLWNSVFVAGKKILALEKKLGRAEFTPWLNPLLAPALNLASIFRVRSF